MAFVGILGLCSLFKNNGLPINALIFDHSSFMDWTSPLWYTSYIVVLIGLAGYGSHRLTIVYLYLKHSRKHPKPKEIFKELPLVTIQLPVFNEM